MTGRAILSALLAAVWLVGAACGGPGPSAESTAAGAGFRAPDSPIVNLRIVFRSGSVDDPAGLNGLNALTALMIGAGGTESLAYEDLAQTLYPWSASISAQYDKEVTTITGRVHRDHLEPFYAIVRDLIAAPRFDPADFERNRDRLRNGVVSTLRGNDDEELGKEALNALMYRGHPYAAPAMGTEAGLEAITLDGRPRLPRAPLHAGQFPGRRGWRVPARVRGADRVRPARQPAGGRRGAGGAARAPRAGGRRAAGRREGGDRHRHLHRLPDRRDARRRRFLPAAGGQFLLRRTPHVQRPADERDARRARSQLRDYSYIENFIQEGFSRLPAPNIPRRQQFFSIWIRPVAHHNAHFALRQALRELQRLVEHGLSPEDFEATRDFLINYSQLHVQTTDRRLGYLLDARLYEAGFLVDEIGERLPRLTVDDVNAAVRRHLRFDDLAVAIVTSDAEAFVERLLANEPSPPTYNTAVGEDILAEDAEIVEYPIPFNPERVQIVPVREMFRDVE